jgi:hypothetical protein
MKRFLTLALALLIVFATVLSVSAEFPWPRLLTR